MSRKTSRRRTGGLKAHRIAYEQRLKIGLKRIPLEDNRILEWFGGGLVQAWCFFQLYLKESDEGDYLNKKLYVIGIEEKKRQKAKVKVYVSRSYFYCFVPTSRKVYDASGKIVLRKRLSGLGKVNLDKMLKLGGIYFLNVEKDFKICEVKIKNSPKHCIKVE